MSAYTEAVIRWQSRQLRSPKDLDQLLQSFNPLFAVNAILLEGESISLPVAEEYYQTGAVSQFTGNPKALVQLYNHKLCYEYLRERILARDDLDTSLVLEVHRILNSGTYNEPFYLASGERPGQLKRQDFVTASTGVGASAQDVGRELDRLMEEISGYCGGELLSAAAYFHCRFENIHPFASGNGATGRVLMNYFLLIRDHPPLIVFAQDQEEYIQCLTRYDRDRDAQPLAEFLKRELVQTWEA